MAKKPVVKPLFDLKHDYDESLARFIHEAGMLRDAIRTLLSMDAITGVVAETLKERVAALTAASFSEAEE